MSNVTLPLTDLYAPVEQSMSRAVQILDRELQSALPFVNGLCERVRAYRGKMLRPALLLLTAKSVGNVREDHYTLAAVVEMVHLATLVHDDVLDEAEVRRRRPTVNSMSGNEAAVMLGDYLISHAFHLCSSLDSQYASRLIGHTTNVVCEGELMQIHHRGNYDLSEREYLQIIRRKTAALTGTCCTLGARCAGADTDLVAALTRFGVHAGMAFQIVDDILDLVGSERAMGKTLGRDVDLGKPTLPVIHYLANAEPAARAALIQTLQGSPSEARSRIAAVLRESGSITGAVSIAREYVRQALAELEALPESAARSSLAAMTEFILQREM